MVRSRSGSGPLPPSALRLIAGPTRPSAACHAAACRRGVGVCAPPDRCDRSPAPADASASDDAAAISVGEIDRRCRLRSVLGATVSLTSGERTFRSIVVGSRRLVGSIVVGGSAGASRSLRASASSSARCACLAARSARRRSRQCSVLAGGGIGVAMIVGQSKVTSGFCASSVRRTSSSKGGRPTLTPGGVRYQYRTRGRDGLPRRFCGVNEVGVLVAPLVAGKSEKGHGLLAFWASRPPSSPTSAHAALALRGSRGRLARSCGFRLAAVAGAGAVGGAEAGAASRVRCTSVNRTSSPMP